MLSDDFIELTHIHVYMQLISTKVGLGPFGGFASDHCITKSVSLLTLFRQISKIILTCSLKLRHLQMCIWVNYFVIYFVS